MKISTTRFLFALTVAWGCLIFWFAPHPPMVDLPQHAGQIVLLRDMLLGQCSWSDFFRINLFTPYLIGYGLALPLSLILPVATALKVMLSLAYIAFVSMSVKLRKHFGADERLDWWFVLSFFGFACQWGFFTFLVAAPVGLLFILVSDRYARDQTNAKALGTLAVGLVLLVSHGLVFLFGLLIFFAFLLARARNLRALVVGAWPFFILVVMCGIYFLISQKNNAGLNFPSKITWAFGSYNLLGFGKILKALAFSVSISFTSLRGISLIVQLCAILILIGSPWIWGLRINPRNLPSWIPFGIVMLIIVIVPSFALSTSFLYERFALFLFPAYAWMFAGATDSTRPAVNAGIAAKAVMPLLILCCWANLTLHACDAWKFGKETAPFDEIVSSLKPGKRALALIFDTDSKAASNPVVYDHYAVWYQAEEKGLVDFNFAWFPPQIVRFKLDHLPAVRPSFEGESSEFSWVKSRGDDYHYFFVRSAKPVPGDFFKGASCSPKLIAETGMWSVFENLPCV